MKPKKQDEQEIKIEQEQIEAKDIEYAKVNLTFGITKDEAEAILQEPEGQISSKLREYINSVIYHLAEKFLHPELFDDDENDIVKECNKK